MENNRSSSPSISPAAVVVAAVFLLVSVIGINWFTTFVPVVLPPQASAESKSVDELFYILVIIGGVVFFLIQGMLLISVIAFRARPEDRSDGPTYHGNPLLEIVWTIIPALVVAFLAVLSFNVWSQNSEPKAGINLVDGENISINVTGARYAWTHNYVTERYDPDGNKIVINSGTKLHTYIGQNVDLTLQTQDVIHSYWVPAMRVKQDLLPGDPMKGGRPTELRFTPIHVEGSIYPAEYPIVCAELCGDGHGRMRGTVIVYDNESQFLEQFYEPAIHAILNPPADPVLRGEVEIQKLYLQQLSRSRQPRLDGHHRSCIGRRCRSRRRAGARAIRRRIYSQFNLEFGRLPCPGLRSTNGGLWSRSDGDRKRNDARATLFDRGLSVYAGRTIRLRFGKRQHRHPRRHQDRLRLRCGYHLWHGRR